MVLEDANEGPMVSDDRNLGTINMQMKMFHSPHYNKNLSLRLGVVAFNITHDMICLTKNVTLLFQKTTKTKWTGIDNEYGNLISNKGFFQLIQSLCFSRVNRRSGLVMTT